MRAFRTFLLFLAAMTGVGAAVAGADLPADMIASTGLSERMLIILSYANNAIILAMAVMAGALTAHRLGLTSLIAHAETGAGKKAKAFPIYAAIGVGLGAGVAVGDSWIFENIAALKEFAAVTEAQVSGSEPGLAVRFLYGGVTEEVLVRWGLLSLIAWIIWAPTKNRALALWIAVPLAALLFGAGHLPALFALAEAPPQFMLIRVVTLNAVLGIVYGVAYARNSLEAAMVTHAATHIGLLLGA